MEKYDKYSEFKNLSLIIGSVIGATGIIIGFWDKLTGIYFILIGIWLWVINQD